MKQVIIVAPYFPPSNMTAGHRCRYFAMHLPKFGWKVKVLSVNPKYYEEKLDYELEKLLPVDLEIIRTKAFPIRPMRLIGDIGIRSFWWHYKALCDLIRKEKVNLIYISISPNYSAMLGPLIYRKFKIPYAIDYQDPWVHPWPGSEVFFSKAWLSFNLGRVLEPIALRNTSFVTAVAPGYYGGAVKRYSWLKNIACVTIPLGAEEADFKYPDNIPRPPYLFNPQDGNFHIVYAGAMLPRAYTTLEGLFKAIIIFKKNYPSIAQRLKLHFIGTGSRPNDSESFTVKPYIERYELSDIIHEYPARIPYVDVLNHLKYSSAVLILGSSEEHYTPSKIFQAVLSHRPILALLHTKSTAVEILKKTNAGLVVTFDKEKPVGGHVDEIVQALYHAVSHNYSPEEVNWEVFREYSAEAGAKRLAEAFNSIFK